MFYFLQKYYLILFLFYFIYLFIYFISITGSKIFLNEELDRWNEGKQLINVIQEIDF